MVSCAGIEGVRAGGGLGPPVGLWLDWGWHEFELVGLDCALLSTQSTLSGMAAYTTAGMAQVAAFDQLAAVALSASASHAGLCMAHHTRRRLRQPILC